MPGFSIVAAQSTEAKPRTTYAWEIQKLFGNDKTKVFIPVKDCTLPTISMGREEVDGSSVVYKYPSRANWDDVRITFYDIPFGGNRLVDMLRQWRQRVWNAKNGIGQAKIDHQPDAGYKQDTFILVSDNSDMDRYAWKLWGSWPGMISDGELTYTTADIKIVSVAVVYDWAETEDIKPPKQQEKCKRGVYNGNGGMTVVEVPC